VDSKLSEALAPVLDDLRNSGGPIPDVRDAQWSNFPGQVDPGVRSMVSVAFIGRDPGGLLGTGRVAV
jgi:hypothetical protein